MSRKAVFAASRMLGEGGAASRMMGAGKQGAASRMHGAGRQGAASRTLGAGKHVVLPVEYYEQEGSFCCQ